MKGDFKITTLKKKLSESEVLRTFRKRELRDLDVLAYSVSNIFVSNQGSIFILFFRFIKNSMFNCILKAFCKLGTKILRS